MNLKENNYLNISKEAAEEQNSTPVKDNSIFCEGSIEYLLDKLNRKEYSSALERNNLILDVVRIKQPISKYALAKITGLSYGTIKVVIKNFAFVDLVKTHVAEGDNGLPVKLISIKEEENETTSNS